MKMEKKSNKQKNNTDEEKRIQQWHYERFIEHLALMIQKYGHIVLEELDKEEKEKEQNNGEEIK